MRKTANHTPKEITKDIDSGIEIASFPYYDGIHFCKENEIKQATTTSQLGSGNGYIVSCGDVMLRTNSKEWPEIERRLI